MSDDRANDVRDSPINVRDEALHDRPAVHAINVAAFHRPEEAVLVDRIREAVSPAVSLIAEVDGEVTGHILFTPVTIDPGHSQWSTMSLGPMAVMPALQRRGIGSTLVRQGLERCKSMNIDAVFVLGYPSFYPRFGFEPASLHGFRCRWNVPHDVFMVKRLTARQTPGGVVQYHSLFDEMA